MRKKELLDIIRREGYEIIDLPDGGCELHKNGVVLRAKPRAKPRVKKSRARAKSRAKPRTKKIITRPRTSVPSSIFSPPPVPKALSREQVDNLLAPSPRLPRLSYFPDPFADRPPYYPDDTPWTDDESEDSTDDPDEVIDFFAI